MLTLGDLPIKKTARIIEIRDGARSRLLKYGLRVGDLVWVVRTAPLGGPILVEVNSREMAIGRQIADKIIVEVG